jgi:hypothetical protein
MHAEGDQSEEGPIRGTLSEEFYPSPDGELTAVERPAEPPEMPVAGEIRDMFDEMSEPIYSTYATGRYVFSGGQLRFVVSTHQSRRLSAHGRYVARYDLRQANIPELCTTMLGGWIERHRAELEYAYAPDYIRVGRWPLDAVELPNTLQSMVRLDAHREPDVAPPGTDHPIDQLTADPDMSDSDRLPHYPDYSGDESFWEPN